MPKYCAECGAENRDTARFCQMCAQPLNGGSFGAVCNRCGRTNRSGAQFCQSCGASLGGPGASAASTPLRSPTGMLPSNMILTGRYIILSRIGQGGMGAVYKATDTLGNRIVAIKELSESTAATAREREEARAAFQREAEMLARLKHAQLPRVYDFFEDSGKQYLVMDFVAGETLETKLKQSPTGLPVDTVLKVADQLCDVLDYLHNQRKPVIFRDLKPGNIMLDSRSTVKLIDFGIARHFAAGKRSDTTALGTAGYAPPEQYGKGQTDARSDIYALGATLHHLLTGVDPADSPFTFVSPRKVRPAVPIEVDLTIMKAVERDPKERWQTARLMKRALHGVSAKPKSQADAGFTPSKPVAVAASAPAASTPASRPPPVPAPVSKATAPAPSGLGHGPLRYGLAVFLGLLIGVVVLFGREMAGWYPRADSFAENALSGAIYWFAGTLAYVIARRPVAACAAWMVEPMWIYSGSDWLPVAIPVMAGVVLGWLMDIGGSRLTYPKLLTASLLTMAAEQMAFMYFYSIPFRWELVAGAALGASVAFVVGWAFRR